MFEDFSKFISTKDEKPLPSNMIPLEIERWLKYRQEIQRRNKKQLYKDRVLLLDLMTGPTHPIARAFELNPNSRIDFNPTYNPRTNRFPLWDAIHSGVFSIGYGKGEAPTYVKNAIISAINRYVRFLKRLNLKKLDEQAMKFATYLNNERRKAMNEAVVTKTLYKPISPYNLKWNF